MYTRLKRQKNSVMLLERPVLARQHDRHQQHGDEDEGDPLGNAEEPHRLRHADVLGDERQPVDQREVEDGEPAPERAEAVEDRLGVAALGDGAQPDRHLLDVVRHRHQDDERPEQVEAGLRAGLGVRGDAARVVVGHHRDDPGPEHGEQDQPAPLQAREPMNELADPVHALGPRGEGRPPQKQPRKKRKRRTPGGGGWGRDRQRAARGGGVRNFPGLSFASFGTGSRKNGLLFTPAA